MFYISNSFSHVTVWQHDWGFAPNGGVRFPTKVCFLHVQYAFSTANTAIPPNLKLELISKFKKSIESSCAVLERYTRLKQRTEEGVLWHSGTLKEPRCSTVSSQKVVRVHVASQARPHNTLMQTKPHALCASTLKCKHTSQSKTKENALFSVQNGPSLLCSHTESISPSQVWFVLTLLMLEQRCSCSSFMSVASQWHCSCPAVLQTGPSSDGCSPALSALNQVW